MPIGRLTVVRLTVLAVSTALFVAVGGATLEYVRFGAGHDATAARLEREVRAAFAARAARLRTLAERLVGEAELIRAAAESDRRLPDLFARLDDLARLSGRSLTSATIYTPDDLPGRFRVLAWTDGPGEDLDADRLDGSEALFVAPGSAGQRLVFVQPIDQEGRRVGVVATEEILSPSAVAGNDAGQLETSFGPVTAIPHYAGAGEGPTPSDGFLIEDDFGLPILEVRHPDAMLDALRSEYRRRLAALVALPLIVLGLLLTAPLLRRRNSASDAMGWLAWSLAVAGILVAAAAALAGLVTLVGAPASLAQLFAGFAALGLASLLPAGWWISRPPRHRVPSAWSFPVDHLGAGALLVGTLYLQSRLLRGRISASSLDAWQFPLFPFDVNALLYFSGLLLTELALFWTAATTLGLLSRRWRLTSGRRPGLSLLAAGLWLAPTAAVLLSGLEVTAPAPAWLGAGFAMAVFGLTADTLRRLYRHASQTARLALAFLAIAGPILVSYPMMADAADRAARSLVETTFAPSVADYAERMRLQLLDAQAEIDAYRQLPDLLVSAPQPDGEVPSQAAFTVWNQTRLAESRATTEIELFGPDRRMVSRFALNVPEYSYGGETPIWQGANCEWDIFGEVSRVGAVERDMFHADRGVCDASGNLLGAIIVHLVPDYSSLSFAPSSASPYADALRQRRGMSPDPRLAGLEVTVYGWSFTPQFTSGRVAWPISSALADRLYASREAFWDTRLAGDTAYRVYFSSNRGGVYALGYPRPTPLEHATRLAESTTIAAVLLVLLLLGATLYSPLLRRRHAPLPRLFHEFRTSFYRKLFLFFVLAAVGPIVVLALAFGTYTAGRVRADVESEAANLALVTRRLFEEFTAASVHPDQAQPVPSDDLMVSIRQVIDQDVNLFVGPRLAATSQRDLFESRLLPTRTPAAAYRAIGLDRLPFYVGEDRLGTFAYQVAAVPVFPAQATDMILSVPLATRQREIDHQLDELNRRVLVGAVVVLMFAAGLGASVAGRVADPVSRLTRAARQIAAGRLDVRIVADTADELRRLVDDFNDMAATLGAQRAELERTHQLKAWAEMSQQVAHEIKNPLTPIQLAAEHLQRVHHDQQRPLGPVFDQCVTTILGQVRLLRQIASEFSNFAAEPVPRPSNWAAAALLESLIEPYELGLRSRVQFDLNVPADLPDVRADQTLIARALTNLVENAVQAMPDGGTVRVDGRSEGDWVTLIVADTGVGMDPEHAARAFDPHFSTKTAGSGLGLPNAKRNVERCGGSLAIESEVGRGTTITVMLPAVPRGEAETG